MHNMPQLYVVEEGKNMDRSDACDLWFLFQFLDMNFSTVNFKAHKNFVLVIKNTSKNVFFSILFFFHADKMLR